MIKSVVKINGFASFGKYKPEADLPDFTKHNLIYGWNGAGKTCFSRILRSFELGKHFFDPTESQPEFEFKLDDGTSVSSSDLNSLNNIRVFNKDFVDESIFSDSGPKPIFFLGKESKEDKEKIIQFEKDLVQTRMDVSSKEKRSTKAKESKERVLTDKARDIRTALTTPMRNDRYRNYDRTALEAAILAHKEALKDPSSLRLSDIRIDSIKRSISQQSKPRIPAMSIPDFDTKLLQEEIESILSKAVVSQVIRKLQNDEVVSKWVEQGLKIHKTKELKVCAFCDQEIPDDRISDLEKHFNDEYQKLLSAVQQLKMKCDSKRIQVTFTESSMFYDDIASEYMDEKKYAEADVAKHNHIIDSFVKILEKKEQNLFSKPNISDIEVIEAKSFTKINQLINQHNQKTSNFEAQVDKDKQDFELHLIADFLPTYQAVIQESEDSNKDHISSLEVLRKINDEIRILKENLISHHIPTQQINDHLHQFLGRDDIKLEATESKIGYRITRNGILAKNLSEGERTALAIVYFIAKIKEDGFNLSKGIVIIDDPVSSLDSNAIFQSFGFIKESIKSAGQVFILTHHFDYFRQVKNWFKFEERQHKGSSSFYMMTCGNVAGVRQSALVKIDDLLIKYESEYHFLFSILHRISIDKEKDLEKVYSIPNVARKFLENFLAFRVPIIKDSGEPSLYMRLKEIQFDEIKKTRIQRFIETHSHPRYENGVQDFDMTILSETSAIVDDLMVLVKTEDEKHFIYLSKSITE